MKSKWAIYSLLSLGLCTLGAKAQMAPQRLPQAATQVSDGYLQSTVGGLVIKKKPLPLFASPDRYASRWKDIDLYFSNRFGITQAFSHHFLPQAIVLHSTESETETSVFNTFASHSNTYLGGVWTTFAIDTDGHIYQYSPLNKLSKGQAGVNDLAIGIEIVGSASTYHGSQRTRKGSIAHRYEAGRTQQMQAVIDLTQTLQNILSIPTSRVFSHEEVAQIRTLSGTNPDYDWLKQNIKDKVYLGEKALLNGAGKPTKTYGYLEPYGRTDPGADVMKYVRENLP